MVVHRIVSLGFALVVAACRKPETPRRESTVAHHTPPTAADVPHDVSEDVRVYVLPRSTPPPGTPRPDAGTTRRTAPARTVTTNTGDPWALIALPDGALWVRAVNTPGRRASEIHATVFGRDGVPRGGARLLRRTTGPVRSISADAMGTHVWVAWHTVRDGDTAREEHIVAAMRGNADLGEVGAPLTLQNFSYTVEHDVAYAWEGAMVRVFAREDGGALAVATGARAVCVHGEEEGARERVPCEGWTVTRIEPGGATHTKVETLLCPVGLPHGFVRIPGGIAYAVRDDHIGTKFALYTEATGAATPMSLPDEAAFWHYGDAAMAWGDGAFALRATSLEDPLVGVREGASGVFVHGATATQRTPALNDRFNNPVMPAFRRSALRCDHGHPVVQVQWAGGRAPGVTFDPTHAGTSIDLVDWIDVQRLPLPSHSEDRPTALVWAGAALLGVAEGTLLRWTCPSDGLPRLAPL
jgi:hypothetical protein